MNALKAWIARHIIADDPHNDLSVLDMRDGLRPDCRCGHVHEVHMHYRDGSDCSQCECRSYRSAR